MVPRCDAPAIGPRDFAHEHGIGRSILNIPHFLRVGKLEDAFPRETAMRARRVFAVSSATHFGSRRPHDSVVVRGEVGSRVVGIDFRSAGANIYGNQTVLAEREIGGRVPRLPVVKSFVPVFLIDQRQNRIQPA